MQKLLFSFVVLGMLGGFSSCRKVIDLKVGDSTPQVVIAGSITDTGNARVRLTKSVSFTQDNTFPPVTDARVWVTDQTAGLTDSLVYDVNGYYRAVTPAFIGQAGHTYLMTAVAEGKTYTATSTLPPHVPIDSIRVETQAAFGQKRAQLFVIFTDPPGIPNYYRFVLVANGKIQEEDARDDRFSDGRINGRPSVIGYDDAENIRSGTVVEVDMYGIDEPMFQYFSSIRNADGNSAAPANPKSNITGGALGYFGAFSLQRQQVILP